MLPEKSKGFMTFSRELPEPAPAGDRVGQYNEFAGSLPPERLKRQGYRCMNCGVPSATAGAPSGTSPRL